jgi:hypothetical protein
MLATGTTIVGRRLSGTRRFFGDSETAVGALFSGVTSAFLISRVKLSDVIVENGIEASVACTRTVYEGFISDRSGTPALRYSEVPTISKLAVSNPGTNDTVLVPMPSSSIRMSASFVAVDVLASSKRIVVAGTKAIASGAEFVAAMVTVEVPVAVRAPPPPWLPELPSENVQVSWIEAGGVTLVVW